MTQATPNLSTYQLLQLKRKELEKIKKQRELESILPHLYVPMYAWQRKIHESTNRVNLLTAANQIGKSSSLIRRAVANCTDQKRWERMWGKNVKPRQFWYFYPDPPKAERLSACSFRVGKAESSFGCKLGGDDRTLVKARRSLADGEYGSHADA